LEEELEGLRKERGKKGYINDRERWLREEKEREKIKEETTALAYEI